MGTVQAQGSPERLIWDGLGNQVSYEVGMS